MINIPGQNDVSITISATDNASKAFASAAKSMQSLSSEAKNNSKEMNNASNASQQSESTWKSISGTVREAARTFRDVQTIVRGVSEAFNEFVRPVFEAASGINNITTLLEGWGESSGRARNETQQLTDVAKEMGYSMGDMQHNLIVVHTQLDALGASAQQIVSVTKSMGNVGLMGKFLGENSTQILKTQVDLMDAFGTGSTKMLNSTKLWKSLTKDQQQTLKETFGTGDIDKFQAALDKVFGATGSMQNVAGNVKKLMSTDPFMAWDIAANRLQIDLGNLIAGGMGQLAGTLVDIIPTAEKAGMGLLSFAKSGIGSMVIGALSAVAAFKVLRTAMIIVSETSVFQGITAAIGKFSAGMSAAGAEAGILSRVMGGVKGVTAGLGSALMAAWPIAVVATIGAIVYAVYNYNESMKISKQVMQDLQVTVDNFNTSHSVEQVQQLDAAYKNIKMQKWEGRLDNDGMKNALDKQIQLIDKWGQEATDKFNNLHLDLDSAINGEQFKQQLYEANFALTLTSDQLKRGMHDIDAWGQAWANIKDPDIASAIDAELTMISGLLKEGKIDFEDYSSNMENITQWVRDHPNAGADEVMTYLQSITTVVETQKANFNNKNAEGLQMPMPKQPPGWFGEVTGYTGAVNTTVAHGPTDGGATLGSGMSQQFGSSIIGGFLSSGSNATNQGNDTIANGPTSGAASWARSLNNVFAGALDFLGKVKKALSDAYDYVVGFIMPDKQVTINYSMQKKPAWMPDSYESSSPNLIGSRLTQSPQDRTLTAPTQSSNSNPLDLSSIKLPNLKLQQEGNIEMNLNVASDSATSPDVEKAVIKALGNKKVALQINRSLQKLNLG